MRPRAGEGLWFYVSMVRMGALAVQGKNGGCLSCSVRVDQKALSGKLLPSFTPGTSHPAVAPLVSDPQQPPLEERVHPGLSHGIALPLPLPPPCGWEVHLVMIYYGAEGTNGMLFIRAVVRHVFRMYTHTHTHTYIYSIYIYIVHLRVFTAEWPQNKSPTRKKDPSAPA